MLEKVEISPNPLYMITKKIVIISVIFVNSNRTRHLLSGFFVLELKETRVNIQALINDKVSQALEAAGAPAGSPAAVRQSAKPQFGDYQANGVMGVAKQLGTNPREFAQKYWMF